MTDGSDVTTDTVSECHCQSVSDSGRLTVSLLSTTAKQPISQLQTHCLKHVKGQRQVNKQTPDIPIVIE